LEIAKRKRKPGEERQGFKLNLSTDYRSERFVMYIANAETGILQAATVDSDLTDGEVSQALEELMAQLNDETVFRGLLLENQAPDAASHLDVSNKDRNSFVQNFILINLRTAFERYGPLNAEDTIGILGVIKTSVKRWSVGLHRRGYITFIEGFLGEMGVGVRKLTDKEVEEMDLKQLEDPKYSVEDD
jgi:hypothetical protein